MRSGVAAVQEVTRPQWNSLQFWQHVNCLSTGSCTERCYHVPEMRNPRFWIGWPVAALEGCPGVGCWRPRPAKAWQCEPSRAGPASQKPATMCQTRANCCFCLTLKKGSLFSCIYTLVSCINTSPPCTRARLRLCTRTGVHLKVKDHTDPKYDPQSGPEIYIEIYIYPVYVATRCFVLFQQTRDVYPMMFQCRNDVVDSGPTLNHHWLNVPCLLVSC